MIVALVALAVAGCGGSASRSDEKPIRTTLERYFVQDPRGCDAQTVRLLRNTEDETDLATARRSCRRDESKRGATSVEGVTVEPTRAATVREVKIRDRQADAVVRLRGGDVGDQTLRVGLVEQGHTWKIDRIDGLRISDAFRQKLDRAISRIVERSLRGEFAADGVASANACIVARSRVVFPNERWAARVEGKLAPGTLGNAYRDLTLDCYKRELARSGHRLSGHGYDIAVPRGWNDVTKAARPTLARQTKRSLGVATRFDLVANKTPASMNVVRRAVGSDATLERVYESARAELAVRLPRVPDPTSLAGVDALTYALEVENASGDKIRERQVMALREGRLYVVTFAAPKGQFDSAADDFDAILATWRWRAQS